MDGLRVPSSIQPLVEGFSVHRIGIGQSRASVFRLEHRGKQPLYLKVALASGSRELREEVDRLRWLAGRVAVPHVVGFVDEGGSGYLLMEALPGCNAVEAARDDPKGVVSGIAEALRHLHEQPIAGCPFDQSVTARIERAREHAFAGQVDENDFEPEHRGLTALELLPRLSRPRLWVENTALTHGDPCLPNFLFDGGNVVGYVDCGRFGVADPYQDLALAARSISDNLGDEWVQLFFDAYKLPKPDQQKLAYYRLLDEFF